MSTLREVRPDEPIDVAITVDVEFSIARAFDDPANFKPIGPEAVHCRIDGKDHGLNFLLECLARHGLKATFFVEALHTVYFGDQPMGKIVEQLLRAEQDVQLHLHPVWLNFRRSDWQTSLRGTAPNDDFLGRPGSELDEFILIGLATFARWGVPKVTAMRTSNLQIDRAVYGAMARRGIGISSSVGFGARQSPDRELHLSGGRHRFDGVLEVPVTSFKAVGPRGLEHRVFTVAGTGCAETMSLLHAALSSDVSPLIVLTHPHEFIVGRTHELERARPSAVNKRRFEILCRYLAENSDRFRVRTIAAAAGDWLEEPDHHAEPMSVPSFAAIARMIENKCSDVFVHLNHWLPAALVLDLVPETWLNYAAGLFVESLA